MGDNAYEWAREKLYRSFVHAAAHETSDENG